MVPAPLLVIALRDVTGREVTAVITSDHPHGLVLAFGMVAVRLPAAETERLWRWLQSWDEGLPYDPGDQR